MDVISFSKAKNAEKIAKAADARLTQALKDSKPIDQVSDALVDSKAVRHDTLKKRLDSRDVSVDASLNAINTQLGQSNRTTQVLQTGVNVVNSEVAAPATFQIEGRTLVNMGNSDLQDGKYYVLADKNTKVKTFKEDLWKKGVSKFQRESTLVTKATFEGKVSGSVVENPHSAYRFGGGNFSEVPPLMSVDSGLELSQSNYTTNFLKLDGSTQINRRLENNNQAQTQFKLNVIEHIERRIGLIPKSTIADKVQWAKDNVEKVKFDVWGRGSGPNGNKLTAAVYLAVGNRWYSGYSHTSSNITKLSWPESLGSILMSDGCVFFLLYADPSNGIIPSDVEIDYVELEVQLKPTAQLNKRPIFSRVANFEGKVSGSTIENPHFFKGAQNATLRTPAEITYEYSTATLNQVGALDGKIFGDNTKEIGKIAQMLVSINLVEEVERNIGKIPKVDKYQWLRENVAYMNCKVWGYGSGPAGNRFRLSKWKDGWDNSMVTQSSPVPALTQNASNNVSYITNDGFLHFLISTDASDGTTASALFVDYVEFELELKAEALLRNPLVPFYEVPKSEYDQILIGWNEAEVVKRFPRVEGMQHLQNPTVIAEGENLLPPVYEWNIVAVHKIIAPYKLDVTTSNVGNLSGCEVNVLPNQDYTIDYTSAKYTNICFLQSVNSNGVVTSLKAGGNFLPGDKVTTLSDTAKLRVRFGDYYPSGSEVTIENMMLSIGYKQKPFVPREPSYLTIQAKLGQMGDKKDTLYKDNGEWKVRKEVETDVALDGSLPYLFNGTRGNVKEIGLSANFLAEAAYIINPFGVSLVTSPNFGSVLQSRDTLRIFVNTKRIYLAVTDEESGWSNITTPDENQVKRYFNGWKYSDGITWQSVTGNGQTATAATSLTSKPTDYSPYKLSYVLSTPRIESATEKNEGEVLLNRTTQLELDSGVVMFEKLSGFRKENKHYFVFGSQAVTYWGSGRTKLSAKRILKLYKNGILETNAVQAVNAEGDRGLKLPEEFYDSAAVYSVTYQVLFERDKVKLTTNATDTKIIYAQNLRSSHDDLAAMVKSTANQVSISRAAIIDLYVQLKALKP